MRLASHVGAFRTRFAWQIEVTAIGYAFDAAVGFLKKRAVLKRAPTLYQLDELDRSDPRRRLVEGLSSLVDDVGREDRDFEETDAMCDRLRKKAANSDKISKRQQRELVRRIHATCNRIERNLRKAARAGDKSRILTRATRVPFRSAFGRQHARTVRRSPQRMPRRTQTDPGGSDGDGGGEPPGSCSYPTEALNLTVEGAHPSRLRRLRTSVGQLAFCALEAHCIKRGLP